VSVRLLGAMQWVGLGLGAGVWFAAHVAGFAVTQAECAAGGRNWGISNDLWQPLILGVAIALVVLAEAAAVAVFAQTREAGDELPSARLHFFATAEILANAIFLLILVLDGTAAIVHGTCVQA